jgi:hypothetical protein
MTTPASKSHLSSSPSSSSSSSSSASRPPLKKQKPEEKVGPPVSGSSATGKACAACLTRGDHDVEQCPLLVAIAAGSEDDIKKANAFCQKLSRIQNPGTDVHQWANANAHAWIPIADTQISRIRGDGHCLFAAI